MFHCKNTKVCPDIQHVRVYNLKNVIKQSKRSLQVRKKISVKYFAIFKVSI